ncbi:hypothetical protein T484DRAFT_1912166 [Baffinella frigidus]|nr:hypothetical protein T484DRAFT_1912166 [Cryptophyta sp. CCMP2293]
METWDIFAPFACLTGTLDTCIVDKGAVQGGQLYAEWKGAAYNPPPPVNTHFQPDSGHDSETSYPRESQHHISPSSQHSPLAASHVAGTRPLWETVEAPAGYTRRGFTTHLPQESWPVERHADGRPVEAQARATMENLTLSAPPEQGYASPSVGRILFILIG